MPPNLHSDVGMAALTITQVFSPPALCTAASLSPCAPCTLAHPHRSLSDPPDAAAYLRDATLTTAAFVSCLPAAAAALLQPGHGALLGSLAQAHDRLLPLLARVFGQPGVDKADGDAMMARLGQVGGTWHVARQLS